MSLDPIKKDLKITPAELPNIDFGLSDSVQKSLDDSLSLFIPTDKKIKLTNLGKSGSIIYEDLDKEKMRFLEGGQSALAEEIIENDGNKIANTFGGFFGKTKSAFNHKDHNFI